MEEVLKDKYGMILGKIRDNGTELVLYDKYGMILGKYEKNTNWTKDKYGNRVGTGNLLVAFLHLNF